MKPQATIDTEDFQRLLNPNLKLPLVRGVVGAAKPVDLDRLFSLLRVWMPKMERL